MDDFKDERFKGIIKDPRFKKFPSKHRKTKLDKHIHGMFSDKRFNLGSKVDKRGLPLDYKVTKGCQKFYQLDGDQGENESSSEDENSARDLSKVNGANDLSTGVKIENDLSDNDKHKKNLDEKSDDGAENEKCVSSISVKIGNGVSDNDKHKKDVSEESDDGSENEKCVSSIKKEKFPDLDGSDEEDGSTSTDTDVSDNEQDEEVDHHWQELDADAPRAENITRRLAVCNMDWDRLRAEDFLVVFNSFKPSDGVIHSVKIYPSEFGLERMEKEKLHGPAELINTLDSTEDKATNSTQGSQFHREKLRQYQINRLKYYFAVVDCDSPQTADALYDQLNGMEFESSGCILDLRFIPDVMTFDQEPVSVASSISCPEDYKPTNFVTSALNQIKVDLTWDETDPRRKEVLEKAFTDPESIEKDLKEYLASPSESEDEAEELEDGTNSQKLSCKEAIAKYKALLQTFEEKEKNQENDEEFDMEITWDSGLKEKTEKLVKEKTLKETLTPFEEKLQKRKELKKLKKETKMTLEKEDNDFSSSEEFGSADITDDELQEEVRGSSKGHKKHKVKLEANSETGEKKLAELALLVAEPDVKDSSDSDDGNNEMKKKKKKKKKKGSEVKEDSLQEYVDDPRFAAMYTSHLYHVDPAEQKFKGKQSTQVFIKAAQRKKYGDSDSAVTFSEISKKETDFIEGSKGKVKKSIKVEALKEKLTPFCKEFQKKKQSRKLGKQDKSLQEEGHISVTSENLSGSLSEASNSKKRKKKQKFHEDKTEDEMSIANGTMLESCASAYLEENDDSDMLIFSRDSSKKQLSSFSSESPHSTNSVRKKFKKNRVS